MKRHNRVLFGFIATGVVFLLLFGSSCKKKRAFNEEDAQDTVDARYTQGECDEIVKDVNTVIIEQFLLRGKSSGAYETAGSSTTTICGASIDTTLLTSGIVTINYDGSNCFGRVRTGKVKFTIEEYPVKKWKNQGARIYIEFLSYKLFRSSDGKSIKLDGAVYLTNESGKTWYDLLYLNEPKVTYRLTGDNVRASFDQEDFALFGFDRRMTYSNTNYVISCLVEGMGNSDWRGSLENWGQNRKGESFFSSVTAPYTWKTECGSIAPISGEVEMKISGKDHTLKCFYSVDKDGNDVAGTSSPCPFGWKVTWNYKSNSKNRVFSFY